MMRSLFSAVSGLKTHQTRMDVIGNNISNVNTEAFKSSQVRFSEIMYQTTASASGGDAARGVGGVNAKQIGLGVAMASTMCNITGAGAAETTGNPFDLRLSDSQTTNFFIVSDGKQNLFTRAGSFYVDGNGYLCMSSTGYVLQGWQVDPTTGEIRKDTVSPLQVMSADNQTSAPEATTQAYVYGILDKTDTNIENDGGYVMTLGFYDDLGYNYTAKFSVTQNKNAAGDPIAGSYHVSLADIVDSSSKSILGKNADGSVMSEQDLNMLKASLFGPGQVDPNNANGFGFVGVQDPDPTHTVLDANGNPQPAMKEGYDVQYDKNKGIFVTIDEQGTFGFDANGDLVEYDPATGQPTNNPKDKVGAQMLRLSMLKTGMNTDNQGVQPDPQVSNFADVNVDFTRSLNQYNGGTSTYKALKGRASDGDGAGKRVGRLTGLQVDQQGRVYGNYDNGNTVLLCQIAAAQFANASGLEKVGDNCYQTTLNSGEFDGIGVEINADGSKINSGELEMSNVDLSGQFTDMIVTQRGFQANSRVITVSDTLLEELINLKR